MKKITLFSIIVCLFFTCVNSQQTSKNFIDQNYIEVKGKAEMEIIPDLIYLSITIDEQDNKAKKSLEQLEKEMVKKMSEIGIDVEKDLGVIDYASNFKNYILKSNDIYTQKRFQLVCHDATTVKNVFTELEKLEISNISLLKLDHSKITEYRKDVKIKAIKAAKNKADYLLEAIAQKTGKALYVEEVTGSIFKGSANYMASNQAYFAMNNYDKRKDSGPEFEKIKVESTILVRFAIE